MTGMTGMTRMTKTAKCESSGKRHLDTFDVFTFLTLGFVLREKTGKRPHGSQASVLSRGQARCPVDGAAYPDYLI